MKTNENPKFEVSPEFSDCFTVIFPVDLRTGDIFSKETERRNNDNNDIRNHLFRVTKTEPLTNHPNHIVISSILVGTTVTEDIFEKQKSRLFGKITDMSSKYKLGVTKYFNEDHLKKEDCALIAREKAEIFFISTNEQPTYYLVDISKLESVKVPIEVASRFLGL